jgi:hypothetical protein
MLAAVASRYGVAKAGSSVAVFNICSKGVGLESTAMVGVSRGTGTSGVGLEVISTGGSTSGMLVAVGGAAVALLKNGMSQPTSRITRRIRER